MGHGEEENRRFGIYKGLGQTIAKIILLQEPVSTGAFNYLHLPGRLQKRDGPLWTLPYEARCYIFVALFGGAGFYRRPVLFLLLTAGLLVAWPILLMFGTTASLTLKAASGFETMLFVSPDLMLELLSLFCCGACYNLFRKNIEFNPVFALIFLCGMVWLLKYPVFADFGIGVCGGYVIVYLGHSKLCQKWFGWLERADISYGVYIYAWPIELMILTEYRSIAFLPLACINLLLAFIAGAASWRLVEKPALSLKSRSVAPANEITQVSG